MNTSSPYPMIRNHYHHVQLTIKRKKIFQQKKKSVVSETTEKIVKGLIKDSFLRLYTVLLYYYTIYSKNIPY